MSEASVCHAMHLPYRCQRGESWRDANNISSNMMTYYQMKAARPDGYGIIREYLW